MLHADVPGAARGAAMTALRGEIMQREVRSAWRACSAQRIAAKQMQRKRSHTRLSGSVCTWRRGCAAAGWWRAACNVH